MKMDTTKANTAQSPEDIYQAYEMALREARISDQRWHLEGMREAARNLIAALDLALADKQPGCEEEDWGWCLSRLDVVNSSMMRRCAMFRELSNTGKAVPYPDTIPF
jgi:hypothetical protein